MNIYIFSEFIIVFFGLTSWVILKQLHPSPSRATGYLLIDRKSARFDIVPYKSGVIALCLSKHQFQIRTDEGIMLEKAARNLHLMIILATSTFV